MYRTTIANKTKNTQKMAAIRVFLIYEYTFCNIAQRNLYWAGYVLTIRRFGSQTGDTWLHHRICTDTHTTIAMSEMTLNAMIAPSHVVVTADSEISEATVHDH